MFAEVIVDVAAKQTDKTFEYKIPSELKNVAVGSRVVVPFGRRKVQGFVVDIHAEANYQGELKELSLVLDDQIPLIPELVKLSEVLARKLFTYRISILQAMLPSMLKAGYKKNIVPLTDSARALPIFNGKAIDAATVRSNADILLINKLLATKAAKIDYVVKNKASHKKDVIYSISNSKKDYLEILANLRTNAFKQKILLNDIIENYESYPKRQQKLANLGIKSDVLRNAVNNNWLQKQEVDIYRDPTAADMIHASKVVQLNAEQQAALDQINQQIVRKNAKTFLLEGITGSGKTEVYLHAIAECLKNNKSALMLVPEIALTPQMVNQVKSRFGKDVAVLHSALSEGEKYDEWCRIRNQETHVVVGARSAIFAPLTNIGLIIIDEEHEASYKQDNTPRYHARDVAILRSEYNHCPLVLGSATPSLYSRARAQKGVYQLLRLNNRANNKELPKVQIIDLKKAMFAGTQFDISVDMLNVIKKTIAKKEQVILLLNRRGFSNFMLCRECGYVLQCPNCDISLNYHKDINQMKCHYCGYEINKPYVCPKCHSKHIIFLGSGTQKIQEELINMIPNVRILRMDIDTTRKKGSYQKILSAFGQGQADILLGTQMIAKGLDFPNVTLVCVVNADIGLAVSNYNASEKTFDLLTQVAGRAGRADKEGLVLIQTYNPDHYAIKLASVQDYEQFYQSEMRYRYIGNYPPFYFTTLVSIVSHNEPLAAKQAFLVKRLLTKKLSQATIVLGPTPSAIGKINNQYFYQILVKYKKEPYLAETLSYIQNYAQDIAKNDINVYIDQEPENIM